MGTFARLAAEIRTSNYGGQTIRREPSLHHHRKRPAGSLCPGGCSDRGQHHARPNHGPFPRFCLRRDGVARGCEQSHIDVSPERLPRPSTDGQRSTPARRTPSGWTWRRWWRLSRSALVFSLPKRSIASAGGRCLSPAGWRTVGFCRKAERPGAGRSGSGWIRSVIHLRP